MWHLRTTWQPVYVAAVTGALLAGFSNWTYDDPFITYRYADNLRRGLGFVYNPGEQILSTSAPVFALLLAGLSFLWSDLPRLANLIGAVCLPFGALCLLDVARTWEAPIVGYTALVLYPTFPLLLSTLGSETPFVLALGLSAFAAYARGCYTWAALCAGLAVLARGDAAIVAGLLALHFVLVERRRGVPTPWPAIALFASIVLAWTAFAIGYFSSPLPATLAAKQRQGALAFSQRFAPGFLTVLRPYALRWYHWVEAGLAAAGLVLAVRSERRWVPFLLWPVTHFLAYTALGVSRYPWYYAPLVPGFVVAVGLGIEALGRLRWGEISPRGHRVREEHKVNEILRARRASPPLARSASVVVQPGALAALVLATLALAQGWRAVRAAGNVDNRVAIYRAAGEWLAANTPAGATVGTLEVGVIGYYARRPMVDFAGLIQPAIAEQLTPTATFEDSARWGILTYQPDYLALNPAWFPALLEEMVVPNCQAIGTLEGSNYGYPGTIVIYRCNLQP